MTLSKLTTRFPMDLLIALCVCTNKLRSKRQCNAGRTSSGFEGRDFLIQLILVLLSQQLPKGTRYFMYVRSQAAQLQAPWEPLSLKFWARLGSVYTGDFCRSNSMQFLSCRSCTTKIARVNHSAISARF